MKKFVLSLFALFTIVSQSNAQEKKGFVGISLGPSIPMRDFSSKDLDNAAAGFANTGAFFDISFAYKLGSGNFGVTALLRGQANSIDAQALANEFANQYRDVLWIVESGDWGIGGLMFGGFSSIPIDKKSTFNARAMIGFLSASSPKMTVTAIDNVGTFWVHQNSAFASAFSYLVGTGFNFDLGSKFYLMTNLDYLGSKPEFSGVEIIDSDGGRSTDTWSQKFGTLNLSIGIALKLK